MTISSTDKTSYTAEARKKHNPLNQPAIQWILLAIIAYLSGTLAQDLNLPASWLVGPMLATIGFSLLKENHVTMPGYGTFFSQAIIGMMMAATFQPAVLPLIAANWLPVGLITLGTLAASLLFGFLLTRVSSIDPVTTSLGTLPGGASGMVAMSASLGADTRVVALMQYIRMAIVVSTASLASRFLLSAKEKAVHHLSAAPIGAPSGLHETATILAALVCAWLGKHSKVPAGSFLGPILLGVPLSSLGLLHIAFPPGLTQFSYAIMGVYVGLLFDRQSLVMVRRLLPYLIACTVALIITCTGFAMVLSSLASADRLTAYLATTPGGLDSITVTALGSGADVSLVLAVQLLRLFTVVFAGPPLARKLAHFNRTHPRTDKHEGPDSP